jgi:hydrogenase maturation factor HypF (carbamoyltransferase family)
VLGGGQQRARPLGQDAVLKYAAGFEVLIPERLPVNDAAISYGQLIEAAAADTASAG